jgi:lipopolysaccharide export system protein LptA
MTASTQKHTLTCTPRTLMGKKNRALRKAGNVPAAIFGEGKPTEPVTVSAIDFGKVFTKQGETTIHPDKSLVTRSTELKTDLNANTPITNYASNATASQ